VQYLQRLRYSRMGDRRTVTSSIENLNFTVSAQDPTVGEAELVFSPASYATLLGGPSSRRVR